MASLVDKLDDVDWDGALAQFAAGDGPKIITEGLKQLALWSSQLETIDIGNPALVFIRDMQVQGHYGSTCIATALYKPAAGCLRAMVECALYFTYFREHPAELSTLARETSYYVQRQEVIDFHRVHTPDWGLKEGKLGLNARLAQWYSMISRVVHGQTPGAWLPKGYKGLGDIRHDPATEKLCLTAFDNAVSIVHYLFLITLAPQIWDGFEVSIKRALLKRLAPDVKAALGLTVA